MKVKPSVKPICEKCKVIRRKGQSGRYYLYTRWKRSWTGEYGEYGSGVYGVDY